MEKRIKIHTEGKRRILVSDAIIHSKEAQSLQEPLNKHEPKGAVNLQYKAVAKEILERVK